MTMTPSLFEKATTDDFSPELINKIRAWSDEGKEHGYRFLVLSGPPGVGKTHLAWAIYKKLKPKKLPDSTAYPEFYKSSALIIKMISTMNEFGPMGFETFIKKISTNPAGLVIDDLGAEPLSDFVHQGIMLLFSTREERMLPTVITTNLNLNEVAEGMDDRIASRLGGGVVITMQGDDKRINR